MKEKKDYLQLITVEFSRKSFPVSIEYFKGLSKYIQVQKER